MMMHRSSNVLRKLTSRFRFHGNKILFNCILCTTW